MRAFVARADSAPDLLRGLLDSGRVAQALELADYAMRRGIAAYAQTDDSDGAFGDTLHRIAELHLEACRAARPDGKELGAALFELQMFDQWDFFAFENYAPLLGREGLARYRALAEKAWREVPARAAGKAREPDSRHFHLARIMEALARHSGDLDALIAVKSRDLSHSYRYLEIAQILVKANRHDEALAWAERGRKAFPDQSDRRLVEFLLGAYRRARRSDDAAAVGWEHFERHPRLDAYQLLRTACGAKAWAGWRDKALAHVRAGLKKGARAPSYWTGGGHSLLVEIFLDEGDGDAALGEARAGGCTPELWLKLARTREGGHPEDAIAIYQARVDPIVAQAHNRAYDDAAALVGKIHALMKRTGTAKEFGVWLEGVRAKHKAKRNFMQRLDTVAQGGSKR